MSAVRIGHEMLKGIRFFFLCRLCYEIGVCWAEVFKKRLLFCSVFRYDTYHLVNTLICNWTCPSISVMRQISETVPLIQTFI